MVKKNPDVAQEIGLSHTTIVDWFNQRKMFHDYDPFCKVLGHIKEFKVTITRIQITLELIKGHYSC